MKIPPWPIYTGPNKDMTTTIPRVKTILKHLGNPHLKLKNIIHITGTKGKGSTALYISNILRACGYMVNTYTSPHIYECNERILLNGKQVSDNNLINAMEAVRLICENKNNNTTINIQEPSMFEALTCATMMLMRENDADFNVIEVGMGAIYDATNVFDDNPPIICVFTPIHIDHVKFLGNSVEQVAWNKSFLIKNGTKAVVMSSQNNITKSILQAKANECEVPFIYTYGKDYEVFKSTINHVPFYESKTLNSSFPFVLPNMPGDYQLINVACAITTCLYMQNTNLIKHLNPKCINCGIRDTFNIARMQKIEQNDLLNALPLGSLLYVDGAHNQLSAHALADWLKHFKQQTQEQYLICLAIATTKGADNKAFLKEFFPQNIVDLLIATRANLESIPEPPENIVKAGQQLGFFSVIAYDMQHVINTITQHNAKQQPVLLVCTGSFYIARDVACFNIR